MQAQTVLNGLNILHQNIQGIRSKLNQIEVLLTMENIDIMCISETFLKKQDVNFLQIPGYKVADSYCRNESRGGVYVKNSMDFITLPCINQLSIDKYLECCGILLPELNYIIVCCYRTPDSSFEIFIKTLHLLLHRITVRSRYMTKKVIIAGDFNINLLENTPKCLLFKNTVLKYNLKLTINEPTRITIKSKTCIDNIITNIKGCSSKVLHLGLSDHSAQYINVPCNQGYIEKYWYVHRRNENKYLIIFLKYLSQLSFSEVFSYRDVNQAYNTFISLFKLLYDLCIPVEKVRISFKKRSNWQTVSIKRACKTKRYLYQKILKYKKNELIPYYKKYCKILKSVTRLAKQKTNIKFIKNSNNKNKATWYLIRKQTTSQNIFKTTIKNVTIDNTNITDAGAIAEVFNTYFATINTQTQATDTYPLPSTHLHSLYLSPVDANELKKIITNLKNKKSCGYDNISIQIIKKSIEYISEPLVYLLNLMIETGTFPHELKTAKIKPLFKKGSKCNIKDYRPIALLSNFSKIFERIIYDRIIEFFKKYSIINKNQFGFQKNKSTTLAMYEILKEIWESLNNKTSCVGLFLDMSRAFDCVIYDVLLNKLDKLGIRDLALKLLESYLKNREQLTAIEKFDKISKTFEEVQSKPVKMTLGLPQGSILGPLLFLVYVNDLPNVTDNRCVMFADDATIFIPDTQINFENNINKTLKIAVEWLNKINLNVNLTKTKIIQFRNYKTKSLNLNIADKDTQIETVDNINFLGVTIDCHLNWKSHIEKINKKISSYSYALSILAETTSVDVSRAAYFGQVYPLLVYGIIFWGNSTNVQSTFILQKRCLRIIYNMYSDETLRNVFKEKGYLTLTNIYILEISIFIKQNNKYFQIKSNLNSRPIRSQYKNNLCTPKINNYMYYKSTFCTGIKIFNHLPPNIKAMDLPRFKIHLKKWLIYNVFYNLNEYFNTKH
ncbi:unnamed protein product [Parnassius mnemosyne]|uniref:Reverse transcriptase domain-containing protein n=1 Tax=Parnassius mnemosyne TaxID=213953 RepID=A0AAV1LFS1_9NEOP